MSLGFAAVPVRRDVAITSGSIQKILDENVKLIHSLIQHQQRGAVKETADLQQILHRNLIYLATIADQATAASNSQGATNNIQNFAGQHPVHQPPQQQIQQRPPMNILVSNGPQAQSQVVMNGPAHGQVMVAANVPQTHTPPQPTISIEQVAYAQAGYNQSSVLAKMAAPPIGSVYYAQPGQVPQPSSQPPAQQQPQSQHAGSVQQQAQSVCIQPQSQTLLPQVTGPSLPSSLPQSVPSTINQIMQSVSSSTTGVPPGGPVTVPSVSIVATAGETPSDIIYCS